MNNSLRSPSSDEATFLSQIIETQNDVATVELEPATVMQMIVERTQRLTGATGAVIELCEGDELVYRAASGIMAGQVGERLAVASTMSGLSATTAELLYCKDSETDPRTSAANCRRLGIRSMILVPLPHNGQIVGVLKVVSGEPDAFDDRSISGLRLMAGLLAAALTHASEFEVKKRLLAERTAALTAMRESEKRFRAAFDHAAIGKSIVALDGKWQEVNPALCRMVGYSEQEMLARDFQSITYPEDVADDLAHARKLIAGEIDEYHRVKRYVHGQGHLVWGMLSVALVKDEAGNPAYFVAQIQDITQRKQAEDALRASEDEYRALFEMASVGKVEADLTTGRMRRVNHKACEILGYTAAELLERTIADITHPDDREASMAVVAGMRRGEVREALIEKRYLRKEGRVIWASMNGAMLRDSAGRPVRSVAAIEDITDRKRAEWLDQDRLSVLEMVASDQPLPDVLHRLGQMLARQMDECSAAFLLIEDGNTTVLGSGVADDWLKQLHAHRLTLAAKLAEGIWASPDACGVSWLHSDEAWRELRMAALQHRDSACWAMTVQSADQTPLGLQIVFSREARRPTASELRSMQLAGKLAAICIDHHRTTTQLAHLVRHDTLTGLPNRVMYEDRIGQALALARRSGKSVAVLVLDIDKFKTINDTLGHHAGDHLLQQFAQRLRSRLRESDTMARLGGDEFVVVLPEVEKREDAVVVAASLLDALGEPFDLGRAQSQRATVSIGIAMYPADAMDAVTLQQKADAALYRVKEDGRNGFSF